MKKFRFLLILLLVSTASAQTWNYKSGGNAFDGNYKTASIKGKGTDYPYHAPLLVLNMFNEASLNFYIADAGYFQSSSDIEILWIFDNEPNTLYKSYDFTISDDGKILFLGDFKNNQSGDYIFQINFIEKLKLANKVDVRIKNSYGKNDIAFNLAGSSKAMDYVISKKYKDELIAYHEEIKKIVKEQMEKAIEIRSRIRVLILKAGIMDLEEGSNLIDEIEDNFDLSNLEMGEIDSLEIEITKYSNNLNLFNNSGGLIKKIKQIQILVPKYFKKINDSIYNKKLNIIDSLIQKFNINSYEKNRVCDEIIKSSERYDFDINQLDSLNLVMTPPIKMVVFELFDGEKEKIKEIIVSIPNHINIITLELQANGLKRVHSLLAKYEFTDIEKNKFLEKISDLQLLNIEQKKGNKVSFEFLPYVMNVSFLNNEEKIEEISIFEKDFSKQVKINIKKLNLN